MIEVIFAVFLISVIGIALLTTIATTKISQIIYQVPSVPPSTCAGAPTCNNTDNPCIGNALACGQGIQNIGGLTGLTLTSVTFYVSGSTLVTATVDFGIWNSTGTGEKTDLGQLTFSTSSCVGTGVSGTPICSITKTGSVVIAPSDIIAVTGVSGQVLNVFFYASNYVTPGFKAWDSGGCFIPACPNVSEFGAISVLPVLGLQQLVSTLELLAIGLVLIFQWRNIRREI